MISDIIFTFQHYNIAMSSPIQHQVHLWCFQVEADKKLNTINGGDLFLVN